MRDRKATRKGNKGKKVLRRGGGSNSRGAASLADEGIKTTSNQAAAVAHLSQASFISQEAHSQAAVTPVISAQEEVVTIGRDGVYRI